MKKTKRNKIKMPDGAKWYEVVLFGVLAGALPTALFLLAL